MLKSSISSRVGPMLVVIAALAQPAFGQSLPVGGVGVVPAGISIGGVNAGNLAPQGNAIRMQATLEAETNGAVAQNVPIEAAAAVPDGLLPAAPITESDAAELASSAGQTAVTPVFGTISQNTTGVPDVGALAPAAPLPAVAVSAPSTGAAGGSSPSVSGPVAAPVSARISGQVTVTAAGTSQVQKADVTLPPG